MSNKCKESVCEFPPPCSLSVNSCIPISAKSARNSLVFTFKAVLSVNSAEPAKQSLRHLLRICRGPCSRNRTESDDGKPWTREADRVDGGLSLVQIIRGRKIRGRSVGDREMGPESGDKSSERQMCCELTRNMACNYILEKTPVHVTAAYLRLSSPSPQARSQRRVILHVRRMRGASQVRKKMDAVLIEINYIPDETMNCLSGSLQERLGP